MIQAVGIETIEPRRAAELLATAHNIRNISPTTVASYKAQMLEGRWPVSESMIVISSEGHLLNGYHRLTALVESGMAQSFVVCRGDIDTSIMDSGRVRHLNERLGIDKTVCAIAHYLDNPCGSQAITRKTPTQILSILDKYEEAITFSKFHIKRRGLIAQVSVAFARAWYHEDRDRLAYMKTVIVHNSPAGPEDWAASRLVARLINRLSPADAYRYTERAIWHFCRRNPIDKLYMSDGTLYPLPE